MPYDHYRSNPTQHPTDAWLKLEHADMGVDEVRRNPDGSVTEIQYKCLSRDLGTAVRMQPCDVLGDCPECADLHGPADGPLSASNLTAAASGMYFGDLHPANVLVRDIDPAEVELIDYGCEGSSTVDLHEVLRGLTPDPESQIFVVTHPDTDHLPSAGLSGSAVLDSVDTGKVVRLLKHWNRVSQSDPAPSLSFETLAINLLIRRLVAGSARCAVQAAYLVRDAVVHQGPEASQPAVARFAETWLGLRPTDANIAATGNALLQAPLDGLHPGGDHAAVRQLRTDVRNQRRVWRFIGETQLCGRLIDSLDRPLPWACADGPLTVGDTIAGGVRPDLVDGWSDARLPRVLARLRPDELRVTLTKAHQGLTWAAAAQACGMTESFGERVRCKLKRLAAELTTRIEATKAHPRPA